MTPNEITQYVTIAALFIAPLLCLLLPGDGNREENREDDTDSTLTGSL